MGAQIRLSESRIDIVSRSLCGAKMRSPDLRGGAALLIAALATAGRSEILNAATVGRGYEHLEQKLRTIGARVWVY